MDQYLGNPDREHGTRACTGILLVNLGTPDAPTRKALRRYLAEFLWDPRVVEFPRWAWWLILKLIILTVRPSKSARAYQKVWTEQGSPLLFISKRQRAAVADGLAAGCVGPLKVALGMRYGNPSIAAGLKELHQAGATQILVVPLYPQYSGATTGSTFDAVSRELARWRWVPGVRFVSHYCDDTGFIKACAARIRSHWNESGRNDKLLFSFHGIPKRYFLAGDPYYCHCLKTARLIAEALRLKESDWQVTFQSRFGREEWLKPYTDHVLKSLPGEGVTSVDVFCPGFSADCLETLEEIQIQNREFFEAAGGEHFAYIPALNDDPLHIEALVDLAQRHLQGWVDVQEDKYPADVPAEAMQVN